MPLKPLFLWFLFSLLLACGVFPGEGAASVPHPTLLNARSLGMGGAVRAFSGPVESARVNPAGLAVRRGFFGGAGYATRRDPAYDAFSLTLVDNVTSPMGGALQYLRIKTPEQEREEMGLGLAMGSSGLRWGFTVRYVHGRENGEKEWHNVFDGDVGVLFERPGGIRLAVVGYDLLGGTSLAFLERRIALGVARTGWNGSWNIAADLVRNMDRDFSAGLDLHLGAEYQTSGSPWSGRLGQMWRGDSGKDYQSLGLGYTNDGVDLGYALQIPRQDRNEILHLISVAGSF